MTSPAKACLLPSDPSTVRRSVMITRIEETTTKMSAAEFPTAKSEEEWRAELSRDEYRMLRQQGTEAPRKGEYFSFFPTAGYFACRACKYPLYSAASKFADCGWDAFDKCYYTGNKSHVGVRHDGMGIEIICNGCASHLGHVFYGERHTSTDERH